MNRIAEIKTFFSDTVWNTPLNSLPKGEAFLYRQIRIWMIAFSEFGKDKCVQKASALTYFSLLSIVPVFAMAFGIAQMFGLKEYVQAELTKYLSGQEDVLKKVSDFAENMLSEAGGGIISGISAVFLIYAVAKLLNNIEGAFNHVWNTKEGRSIKRKVTDYMAVIFLGPLILILSSSATVFITNSLQSFTDSLSILGFFQPAIFYLLKLIPYTLIWLLLFLLYLIFPNVSVKVKPALLAALLAGIAYQLTQLAWIKGQVFLSSYSTIYGGFAALPLFLIWLNLSWMILLFGAEFAFAVQNSSTLTYRDNDMKLSRKLKKRLLLIILHKIIKEFCASDKPVSFSLLSKKLYVPSRFVHLAFEDLEAAGLISRVKRDKDEPYEFYQPAMDVSKVDVHAVLGRLDLIGVESLNKLDENEAYNEIDEALNSIESYGKTSGGNKLLRDL